MQIIKLVQVIDLNSWKKIYFIYFYLLQLHFAIMSDINFAHMIVLYFFRCIVFFPVYSNLDVKYIWVLPYKRTYWKTAFGAESVFLQGLNKINNPVAYKVCTFRFKEGQIK